MPLFNDDEAQAQYSHVIKKGVARKNSSAEVNLVRPELAFTSSFSSPQLAPAVHCWLLLYLWHLPSCGLCLQQIVVRRLLLPDADTMVVMSWCMGLFCMTGLAGWLQQP